MDKIVRKIWVQQTGRMMKGLNPVMALKTSHGHNWIFGKLFHFIYSNNQPLLFHCLP